MRWQAEGFEQREATKRSVESTVDVCTESDMLVRR